MNRTNVITAIIAVCVTAVVGVALHRHFATRTDGAEVTLRQTDTVTVTVRDTVRVVKPVVRDSVVIRYETQTVASAEVGGCDGDSVSVYIPISQVCVQDSTYSMWASGYGVSIDSVRVYPQTRTVTLKETVTVRERAAAKRWHVGPTVGFGVTGAGVQPYVGIGISYSIISF